MSTIWEKRTRVIECCYDMSISLLAGTPAECFLLPSPCNKLKASTFPLTVQRQTEALGCHCCNKCGKSLSQPMFLSPLTWLHDCAGTFMDCLIQCWQIKAKSSQNRFKPLRRWVSQLIAEQKSKHFINNKTLFYFILSPWFNLFPSTIFFFPKNLLPACENGVCIDELGPILISHHSWCGHFLVYYTTVAAYSPSSFKVDIWTTWPWQYGDNEISLMTLP